MATDDARLERAFPAGGGEMGARIRAFDWSSTPLGPLPQWPQSLRSTLEICLHSGFPTALYWGRQLHLLYNDAWAPVLAQRHPGALGLPAREVWPEMWSMLAPQFARVIATGEGCSTLAQILPMQVEERALDLICQPVRNHEGVITGVFVQGTDVTARTHAEAALRASEERLHLALLASNNVGTWDWDVLNDRVTADERFARLYGVDPAKAATGATFAEFIAHVHPDDLAKLNCLIEEAIASGEIFSAEYRIVQADGTARWVVAEGRCTKTPGGGPRFPGVSIDITERKIAEETLRKLNEQLEERVAARTRELSTTLTALQATVDRMRTTFQTSFIYQGYLRTDGTLLDANAASLEGVGAQLEDVVGQPFWLTPWFAATPEMPELIRQSVSAAAAGESVRETIQINLPTGARTFDFSMRPVKNRQGLVIGVIPEAVDLTQRIQAEEGLRQSQKMEAVGQLTGGIAHDFNNLLTGIIGSLDMLGRRIAQRRFDSVERYINAAIASANRAAALTHRLLAFSRRQPLDAKPVDVNALIADMEDMLRRSLGEKVQLEIQASGVLWLTRCDPNQLESAILNLVINARDAMPEGGRITVEASNALLDKYSANAAFGLKAGQYVCIRVADTGAGMQPEVMAKAFDPFFTTKPLGQGTGLGLSMIYGFVQQSGGSVTIDSTVGVGTIMKLYLPRCRSTEIKAAPDASVTGSYRSLSGDTILIVEDDVVVRQLIVDVLADLGYLVIEAADGSAGLRVLLSDERIDLLVTDVGLPELDGLQMVDQAQQRRPDLKVLFITGYAKNAMFSSGNLPTRMQLITKPFTIEAFAQRVREMIVR